MSYFNHAYKKTMLLTDGVKTSTALNSASLTAGQLAMVNSSTYGVLSSATAVPNEFLLIQGNYNKTAALTLANKKSLDAIGGNALMGGYAASVKSKLVKAKYITKMWKEVFEAQKGESETIAGFVLEIAGSFPKRGEIVTFKDYQFLVESLDKKRLKQIKVTLPNES